MLQSLGMLRERIRRFMMGRYGHDDLSLALLFVAGVCLAFAALSRNRNASLFFVFVLILMVLWSIFRMLSKNREKRSRENEIYKSITGGFSKKSKPFTESMKEWWGNIRSIRFPENKKNYGLKMCIFKCPGCGADIRIPANKGRIMITCPKCGKEFERVS